MNLATIMSGKLTYRASYTLMLAGLYLIAYQIGDVLDAAVVSETRHLIADVLRGDGFKTLIGGVALYGLRRAMDSGALDTEEEKDAPPTAEEREARIREILAEFKTIVEQSKKEDPK